MAHLMSPVFFLLGFLSVLRFCCLRLTLVVLLFRVISFFLLSVRCSVFVDAEIGYGFRGWWGFVEPLPFFGVNRPCWFSALSLGPSGVGGRND